MRVLICAAGSHGDVLPFITLGTALQRQGAEVYLLTHRYFSRQVEASGLPCIGAGSSIEAYQALLRNPALTDSHRGVEQLAAALNHTLEEDYERLHALLIPGQTVTVGSTLALLPRLLQESSGTPAITTHLAPVLVRSPHRLSRLGASRLWRRLPSPAPSLVWRFLDRFVFDPAFAPHLNALRQRLALPAIERSVLGQWLHCSTLNLGLFPEWFGSAPQNVSGAPWHLSGFPLTAPAADEQLPQPLADFLAAGPPPIVFTTGTATRCTEDFFAASMAACQRAGRRAIFVAAHDDPAPQPLPEGIIRTGFVPFRQLLPQAAALVHHGGIGTFSHALAAGIPQLIRPLAYDQFDNSERAQRLGVALELLPKNYEAGRIDAALTRLLEEPSFRERSRELAAAVTAHDGADAAAAAILSVAERRC